MDDSNDISQRRDQASPFGENLCWDDFFKDASTQVDESDILREREILDESIALNNLPTRLCATGVAETPAIDNFTHVFGTAKLDSEPQLTFILPSIRSAFDEAENVSQYSARAVLVSNQTSETLTSSSLPPVASFGMTSQNMMSPNVATQSTIISLPILMFPMTSGRITSVTMANMTSPVSSITTAAITSTHKISMTPSAGTSFTMPSVSKTSLMSSMTSDSLITSASSFLPLLTTKVSETSKRLSPKLSSGSQASRKSRTPSPSLLPKHQTAGRSYRSPSPRRLEMTSPKNAGAISATSRDQSREGMSPVHVYENIKLTYSTESTTKEKNRKQDTSTESTQGQKISGKSTPEKSIIPQNVALENVSGKKTRKENSAEKITEQVTLEKSSSLETSKTSSSESDKPGSASPEMTASTSGAGAWQNEQLNQSVGGKKRKKKMPSGRGKRRRIRSIIDKMGYERELRGKLPQEVKEESSYKIEEMKGPDVGSELSRSNSHVGNLGRVSPKPNTRLRSRKSSISSASDVMVNDNVATSNDVTTSNDVVMSDDVISTSDVMNDDVALKNDVISGQDDIAHT